MHALLAAGLLLPTFVLAQFDLFFPPELTLHGAHIPVLPQSAPDANIPVAQSAAKGPIPAPDSPRPNAGLLKEVYAWRQMDFEYPSEEARAAALARGDFDPTGTLPLGVARGGLEAAGKPSAGAAWWRGLLFIFSINVMLLYLLLVAALVIVSYLLVYSVLHFTLFVFHSKWT